MPGDEFTTLILAMARPASACPASCPWSRSTTANTGVARDLRGVGLTKISKPASRGGEAAALAVQAADAMRCLDHVRIDIKTDAAGALRVMEVNGIPGLKPLKSWAPQIYTLYFRSPDGEMADYCSLIRAIIEAGGGRYGLR